jgi:hypothetical protein
MSLGQLFNVNTETPMLWDRYGDWDAISRTDNTDEMKAKITDNRPWVPNYCPTSLSTRFVARLTAQAGDGLDFGCGLVWLRHPRCRISTRLK